MAAASSSKSPKKSKKKGSKRRISKHVLNAIEAKKKKAIIQSTADGNEDDGSVKIGDGGSASKEQKPKKIKDPDDVHAYLTNWKKNQTDKEAYWKFNKNTQSWLLRHAYDYEKVPKSTFTLLLEYLAGLKGGDTKKRTIADATHRALRYKEYEKSRDAEGDEEEKAAAATKEKPATNQSNASKEENEDQSRWSGLDDHDKRKEYKRARKMLESLRE
mmetsp:Transcript_899/g.1191  ORF Transcript_899/g.1191 Transcript_899/m.1191 type:complete len:216 (+) Transcript_899:118-765(+)|eukprot:CAMPEP_0198156014 /NCGR_PEP_ID=MMETSP1443-20131203/69435_1 /TAXON_ID=186043 /ORGANISM="Entomoneis sp., Strain CCMP2396" /LENGTH=215 /DNA_ID=CAMNT_0043822789 /DNA_START=98 /DNA_END=745 /DNA_ORIENTATION=-